MITASVWLVACVSAAARIVVVADASSEPFRQAEAGLAAAGRRVERYEVSDDALSARMQGAPDDGPWIALGPRSAALIAKVPARQRAAFLVKASDLPQGVAAVTLDVSPTTELGWIETAFAPRRRLVTLRQRASAEAGDATAAAATRLGLELIRVTVPSAAEAVPALAEALSGHERDSVVWLAPDPGVLSAETLPALLEAALAARVPVVGFSPYFLRIGALAAVDIDFGAGARQALRLAMTQTKAVEPPQVARLLVDGRLAERLGVVVHGGEGIEVRR